MRDYVINEFGQKYSHYLIMCNLDFNNYNPVLSKPTPILPALLVSYITTFTVSLLNE